MRLMPRHWFKSVTDIPISFFAENGIKGVAVDIDNTLTGDNSMYISEKIREWIGDIKKAGIRVVIVSNNREPRVRPFAEDIGLEYLCEIGKPSRRRIKDVMELLAVNRGEAAMIGDQIFTDILFANRCSIASVLVEPLGPDDHRGAALKRFFEHPLKRIIKIRRNI